MTGGGPENHAHNGEKRRVRPARPRDGGDGTPQRSQPRGAHPEAGHGHGHGHGSSPAEPASRVVRQLLAGTLIPFALAAVLGVLLLYPFGHQQRTGTDLGLGQYPVQAEVVAAEAGGCGSDPSSGTEQPSCVRLQVTMSDGPRAGNTIEQVMPLGGGTPRFSIGDQVVLAYAGSNPDSEASYQVVDFQRDTPLLLLATLFAVAVLVLGRWQGLAALVALGLSFTVLIGFILPAILAGENPLLVAVVGAGLIMFMVLYLTHGFSARTSTAVLGTLLSLTLIGVLSAVFAASTRLTGLDDNTASLIGALGSPIDARGLLLAGIVIGALGVLDDVTVTQTSAVWELRKADPTMSWRALYAAGLRIGRDHVSSAVNTLVLAYAGAALPLLLAYALSGRNFGEIASSEAVAQEVVRTLVGSIGLIAAVPITTAIAAAVSLHEPVGSARPASPPTPAERVHTAARESATTTLRTGPGQPRR